MERWYKLLVVCGLITLFTGCGEGIGISPPEPPPLTDPEALLPPAQLFMTNHSYGTTRASYKNVFAGTANVVLGALSLRAEGRTVVTDMIPLTLTGAVGFMEVNNFKLRRDGDPTCARAIQVSPTNLVFNLKDCPIAERPSETVELELAGDVVGGVNRYFQFTIPNAAAFGAHDLAGRSVPATLVNDVWPLELTYLVIDRGSIEIKRSISFAQRTVTAGAPQTQPISVFTFAALGEPIRTTAFNIDLYFEGGLRSDDVYDLAVLDGANDWIAPVVTSLPNTNPRASYRNLNKIHRPTEIDYEIVAAKIRPGAVGALTVCISGYAGQGFTSLSNQSAPAVCGNQMIVVP
jgi:hypothetical protein